MCHSLNSYINLNTTKTSGVRCHQSFPLCVKEPMLKRQQRGSMLVIALFIIVVMALLIGALGNIFKASTDSVIFEVYGVRAQQSAGAGLQQLAMTALPLNSPAVDCNQAINSPSSMSNIDGLKNCAYSASCTTENITFNGSDYKYYWFTSTGSCQVGEQVISRTLSADALQEQ